MSNSRELEAGALYRRCDPECSRLRPPRSWEDLEEALGQPRTVAAVRFNVGIESDGYNIFALGLSGTGKHELVRRFAEEQAAAEPVPPDRPDVEAEVAGAEVHLFFLWDEEVNQQRREARSLEHRGDVAVSGAVAPRTGAVGEEDHSSSSFGHSQIPFELDRAGRNSHRALFHQSAFFSCEPGSSCSRRERSSRSTTSSSDICSKSSYQ